MSTIHKQKCDRCGKETADRLNERGWIQIGITLMEVSTAASRPPARHGPDSLDFCDVSCLAEWVEKTSGIASKMAREG